MKIGKNVKIFGDQSFDINSDEGWINSFYCYASAPPKINYFINYNSQYAFSGTKIRNLYVPLRCRVKYEDSDWGDKAMNIIEMDE